MFIRISVLFIALLVASIDCQSQDNFKLEAGYLLFQDLDCGPLCEAIEAVTQGYNGATLSHMGLLIQGDDSSFMVLEAISAGVLQTSLQEFLQRSSDKNGCPKVLVAKVKDAYLPLIPKVLKEKDRYLDLPYNNTYLLNDSSYYCSQLIYTLFLTANDGQDFFELMPMTFRKPQSQDFFQVWIDYYDKLNCEIPEGELGINPGGMSRSDKIEIIHFYGMLGKTSLED